MALRWVRHKSMFNFQHSFRVCIGIDTYGEDAAVGGSVAASMCLRAAERVAGPVCETSPRQNPQLLQTLRHTVQLSATASDSPADAR